MKNSVPQYTFIPATATGFDTCVLSCTGWLWSDCYSVAFGVQ